MKGKNKLLICIMGGPISAITENQNTTRGFADLPKYLSPDEVADFDVLFKNVAMKDSRLLDHNDRNLLLKIIEETDAVYIIVTHGTDTMEKTAEFIQKNLQSLKTNKNKIIYFVGSEFCLDDPDTDALDNLKLVMSEIQLVSPGVHMQVFEKA